MAYGILPLSAAQRSHELSPTQWKVYSYYLARRNLITRQCNPSHKLIWQDTGVNQSSISTIKKELEVLGWLRRRGKYAVDLLVGIEELERARDEAVARIEAAEGAKFGAARPQDGGASFEYFKGGADGAGSENTPSFEIFKAGRRRRGRDDSASFEIFKAGAPEVREIQTPALNYSKPIEQRSRTEKTTTAAAGRDAWKDETVTDAFMNDIVDRGLYSRPVVDQSWRELAFKVSQRGADARATKGELLAFCRAKQKSGVLPEVKAEIVALGGARHAPPPPGADLKCDVTCPLCFGSQMESVPGVGARRCSNREARQQAARQKDAAQ